MTRINLLPWRQRERDRKQRGFYISLGVAVGLAVLAVAGAHVLMTTLIDTQEQRNQFLRNEIAQLARIEQEILSMQRTEQQLMDRLDAIRRLQRSRPDMVQAFDQMVRLVPEDIFLNSMTARTESFNLRGNARFNNDVSDFMRELDQSPLFGEPQLRVIETRRLTADLPVSAFDIDVSRIRSDG